MIHETAIIGEHVTIGKNVTVGAFTVIQGNTKIGDNTEISSHCVIGTNAEHREFFDHVGSVKIGKNCTIREFVTINGGTYATTTIRDNVILLRGSHVGHDSHIEKNCTVSCNVLIGGESYIMERSNLGLGAILHQGSVIGSFSMIGMGAVITKKTEPTIGGVFVGSPAKYIKRNLHILTGITEHEIEIQTDRFNHLLSL